MTDPQRRHTAKYLWFTLYLATLGLVTWGMFAGRRHTLSLYGTPEAQSDWDQWVDDVREEGGAGPVRRRTPQATRPPALVLMEEHFGTCLIGALVLSSAMFATAAFFIHGVLTSSPTEIDSPPRESRIRDARRHE